MPQDPVPEVPMAAKVIFPSGATVTRLAPRFELVPREAIERMTRRLECGAEVHGDDNLAKGLQDEAFLQERRRHLFHHALLYLHGDASDDHLAAILANAAILSQSPLERGSFANGDAADASGFGIVRHQEQLANASSADFPEEGIDGSQTAQA